MSCSSLPRAIGLALLLIATLALDVRPAAAGDADGATISKIIETLADQASKQKPYDRAALAPIAARLDKEVQQRLAVQLLHILAQAPNDQIVAIEYLWLALIDLCPDTQAAQKGYWRLSNLYRQAIEPVPHEKLVKLMEQFLERYRSNSEFPLVKYPEGMLVFSPIRTLHDAYEALGRHAAIVNYYADQVKRSAKLSHYDYLDYATALEKTGDKRQALVWYKKHLASNPDPSSVTAGVARQKIEELEKK